MYESFADTMERFRCESPASSTEATFTALELKMALARFGLGPYERQLRENGFSNWECIQGITENDMEEMGFRLGDRRKLQRMVREYISSHISKVLTELYFFSYS